MKYFMTIAIGIAIILYLGFSVWSQYSTVDFVKNVSIIDTDNQCRTKRDNEGRSTQECKYIVFTENEVFKNTDNLFHFKFGSSNVQNEMKKAIKNNLKCQLKINGWRNEFFSQYRNILEASCG